MTDCIHSHSKRINVSPLLRSYMHAHRHAGVHTQWVKTLIFKTKFVSRQSQKTFKKLFFSFPWMRRHCRPWIMNSSQVWSTVLQNHHLLVSERRRIGTSEGNKPKQTWNMDFLDFCVCNSGFANSYNTFSVYLCVLAVVYSHVHGIKNTKTQIHARITRNYTGINLTVSSKWPWQIFK